MTYKQEYYLSILLNVLTLGLLWALFSHTYKAQMLTCTDYKIIYRISFEEFKKEFVMVRGWEFNSKYKSSLFSLERGRTNYYSSRIHASIIEFNEKGYLLTTLGNIRMSIFIYRYIRKNFTPDKTQFVRL